VGTVRPEFLNRVDELIMFRPLSQGDVKEIVKLQLHLLMRNLEEKDYHLIPSDELIAHDLSRSAGFQAPASTRRSCPSLAGSAHAP
jgi:ATP-dependent Clp protease ATP-binding subunit ClpA